MIVLGVTGIVCWNSAACLLMNGEIKSFVEEERFNEIKHSIGFGPIKSLDYCLVENNIDIRDVDKIAIGWYHPLRHLPKTMLSAITEKRFADIFREIIECLEHYLNLVRWVNSVARIYGCEKSEVWAKVSFFPHHLSHAASSVLVSGFERTNFMVLDGRGEYGSGIIGSFRDSKFRIKRYIKVKESIGAIYSEITSLIGFKSHSHEGKTMGLAAFGSVNFDFFRGALELDERNRYIVKPRWKATLRQRFKRRLHTDPISQIHRDLAATVQDFMENAVLGLSQELYDWDPCDKICLSGGSFLNCDTNQKVIARYGSGGYFIQPAANDAGVALGAALLCASSIDPDCKFKFESAYLGPEFNDSEIETLLIESKLKYEKFSTEKAVDALCNDLICANFSGRMEVGPRALGNRSILASPIGQKMKDSINMQVKHREAWRPFAPIVLAEKCDEIFFEYTPSPFMLQTFLVKPDWRDKLASVVHADNTARVQEITEESNPRLYAIIESFCSKTGVPALLNTSFNDNEKPISCSPKQAIQAFMTTGIDVLFIGSFMVKK